MDKRKSEAEEGHTLKRARSDDSELNDLINDAENEFDGEENDEYTSSAPVFDDAMLAELTGLPCTESDQRWSRPDPPTLDPAKDSVVFQQFEVTHFDDMGALQLPTMNAKPGVLAPVLRVFGITPEGNSVMANVHGFLPYLYIKMPTGNLHEFQALLNRNLAESDRQGQRPRDDAYIVKMEPCQRKSLLHYQPSGLTPFLKITTAIPRYATTLRGILEDRMSISTYESTVQFPMRFMVDTKMVGGGWVELPAGKYFPRSKKTSLCQLEIDVHVDDIITHEPEGQWSRIAPLRILSFDIECAGRRGKFPEAEIDPVIQIANLVTVQGESQPRIKNIFTLKSCAPIVGAQVLSFENEKEMLLAWRNFVVESDPDIITGYNIVNFDVPYLFNRAAALKAEAFPMIGRMRGRKAEIKDGKFSSKAYGTRDTKEINIEGRVLLDILQAVQRDYKLSSYTLNFVSARFLGEQKEDVHHSIISDLQNGDAETRRRLAVYCLKDAYLPQRLMDKLMFMYNYIEMARVTGVPLSYLLTRGQQIKVISQLLRKAAQKNMVIPNPKFNKAGGGGDDVGYEGATVIDPIRGFYSMPIATLDFASLYPSIMMAHNLCYCSLVPRDQKAAVLSRLDPSEYQITPNGDCFVKSGVQKGILPEILEELLGARKRAKKDLAAATDPLERAVLDGRQLALKISANSVYGFTGATVGKLPCLEISASVTGYGRQMIEQTKKLVEETYNRANGYEFDSLVVYGDTDSVMIKFGTEDLGKAMEMGQTAAKLVSATFVAPIKLEFEKVYYPYLLINKKRYAGLLWTNTEKYDKMDTKGIETVRRDNCSLVRTVIETCLHKILIDKSVEGAANYVKQTISDLLMNRVDLSQLVITKALAKTADDYAGAQAHVALVERMRKRDAATAPVLGDRVPYVIIKGPKGCKAYEKSEDPIWVLNHGLPIDTAYYLEHQLSLPLLRIFEPIMDNAKSLLTGDHTRSIAQSTPSAGGLMKFAVKTLKCMNCKSPLPAGEVLLCKYCKASESEVYQKTVTSVNELEMTFGKLWTQCQRCQGSLHQEVLCTSRDCPIFYRRTKVQKDLAEARETLQRFAW